MHAEYVSLVLGAEAAHVPLLHAAPAPLEEPRPGGGVAAEALQVPVPQHVPGQRHAQAALEGQQTHRLPDGGPGPEKHLVVVALGVDLQHVQAGPVQSRPGQEGVHRGHRDLLQAAVVVLAPQSDGAALEARVEVAVLPREEHPALAVGQGPVKVPPQRVQAGVEAAQRQGAGLRQQVLDEVGQGAGQEAAAVEAHHPHGTVREALAGPGERQAAVGRRAVQLYGPAVSVLAVARGVPGVLPRVPASGLLKDDRGTHLQAVAAPQRQEQRAQVALVGAHVHEELRGGPRELHQLVPLDLAADVHRDELRYHFLLTGLKCTALIAALNDVVD
mmetsp:Transcript_29263/g.40204  ORF Transcript_29263/g.40204 Transcript_29263/m.40204 type:complete len:331 (-) Transcript_29263:400-1392(-)